MLVPATRLLRRPPGAGREGPGGPHGASSPPRLRSAGPALHTLPWLAARGCLCVAGVVTVIQPPATWPQRLARMVVTTPWARAGAPKRVKVAVPGRGGGPGGSRGPGRSPGAPQPQRPAGTSGRVHPGHTLGTRRRPAGTAAALPPPAGRRAGPVLRGLSWTPAASLRGPGPPHPARGWDARPLSPQQGSEDSPPRAAWPPSPASSPPPLGPRPWCCRDHLFKAPSPPCARCHPS